MRQLTGSVRKTTSITFLYFRRSSSVKVFSLLNLACYILLVLVASFVLHQSKDLKDLLWQRKKHLKGQSKKKDIQAYSDLPKMAFGMRASSAIREPEIQKLWDENQMFKRVSDRNNGGSFIFHDGPPYTNSDLHMGHALNKILKDTTNRYKLLRNYKFRDVPGWDCHGQPIELKVLQSWDHDARKELTPLKLRAKAAKFAKATVKTHMASFKQFGRWGDWDHPYLTLDLDYEAAQVPSTAVSTVPFWGFSTLNLSYEVPVTM